MTNTESRSPLRPPRGSIARNTIWNFVGQLSPMFLAAFAVPLLVHHLGVARFGVLSIVWILVGYFSLFDFGVGRAITKLLAETIALGDMGNAAGLIWAATSCMALLGLIFGGALFVVVPGLAFSLLKIPTDLHSEIMRIIPWLAVTVPFVTLTCAFKGILEAQQKFAAVNRLRVTFGIFNYLGPLLVLPFSHSLVPIVEAQAAGRIAICGLHYWICRRSMPLFRQGPRLQATAFRALLGFGSWLTISNILSPMMVYLDRFLIGSLVSISSVAYYSAPFDAVTKLWLVPSALEGVLFPAFSEALALDQRERVSSLFQSSIASSFAVLFPLVLGTVLFARPGLSLWLGTSFATHSTSVLQILAIGVFTNSLAHMPYSLLQASGRPNVTAMLHLIELPFFLGLLYWGVRVRGIEGAATAWTVRLGLEAAVLFFLMRGYLSGRLSLVLAAGAATLVLALAISATSLKIAFLLISLSVFGLVIWHWTQDGLLPVHIRWFRIPTTGKARA